MKAKASLIATIPSSWLLTARLATLGVALLAASYGSFFSTEQAADSVRGLYLPIAFFFGITGLSALWFRFLPTGRWFTRLQLCIDLLIIGAVVWVTGGPSSPFLFLYLPLVMAAALLESRATALFTAFMGSVTYAVLAYGMIEGIVPPVDGSQPVHVPSGGAFLQWVGLSSAMVLVGVATSFLRRSLLTSVAQVEASLRAMSALESEQQAFFEGMPQGFVRTDKEGVITAFNQTAEEFFGIAASEAVGMTVSRLSKLLRDEYELDAALADSEDWNEISMVKPDGTRCRFLYHGKKVMGQEGERLGTAYIFQDVTRLRSVEEQLELQDRMARALHRDEKLSDLPLPVAGFVGESPVMKKLFELIQRVSQSDATVLVAGESGTGKELVAKAIHYASPRSDKPFVPVNCGAIPENLIESELFGHKKGAFTGAVSDHPGLFRRAEDGTLFLDEIGELPIHMQAKLLRAIQEKTIRPVGSDRNVAVESRIIAATNRDLREEVEAGRFREDLYYRLNVIQLRLPALRERKDDIPLLTQSILRRLSGEGKVPVVPPQTMEILRNYDYPGNVRELENLLERAMVLGGDAILPEHLSEEILSPVPQKAETEIIVDEEISFPVDLDTMLGRIEQQYLRLALQQSDGVKKHAAELLGLNFRSFRYRLQKFDINE